jgi:hypothetical protein
MDTIKKQLIQKDSLLRVNKITASELKRELVRSELEGLINYVKNNDFTRYKDVSLDKVETLIGKAYSQRIKQVLGEDTIDVHAILKQEINRSGDEANPFSNFDTAVAVPKNSRAGNSNQNDSDLNETSEKRTSELIDRILKVELDPFKWQQLNREYGRENLKREANFYFDSRYRDTTEQYTDRYVFHFNNTYARQVGSISNVGNIRDIIEVHCDQVILPFNNTTSNYYGQITMQIEQFKNAYISAEGPEFHFIFNTVVLPNNTIRLTPINPICKLREPATV